MAYRAKSTHQTISFPLLAGLAGFALACASSPPPAPVAPTPPASTDAASPPAASPVADALEACKERVLHEGIPTTPAGAPRGNALHRAADEKRLQGDGEGERQIYYQLIQEEPASPYIPFAYFAFGELFKKDAEADPSKAPLAEEAYKESLKAVAPGNRLYLVASFRLARIYELEKQPSAARDAYQRAVDDATEHGDWDVRDARRRGRAARAGTAP